MIDPGFLAMSSVLRLHRSMKAVVDQELKTCCRLRLTLDAHPGDRRAKLVSLTDDGRSLAEAATATLARVDFGLTGLTTAQVTSLADTIRAARTDRVTPG